MNLLMPLLMTVALATSTLASPLLSTRQSRMDPGLFTWKATDWIVGCGSAACGWGFNLTATPSYIAAAPEFTMTCGALYGAGWQDCRPQDGTTFELPPGSNVQAYWPPNTGSGPDYTIKVAHTWYVAEQGAEWNATGEAIATTNSISFAIVGKSLEAKVQG